MNTKRNVFLIIIKQNILLHSYTRKSKDWLKKYSQTLLKRKINNCPPKLKLLSLKKQNSETKQCSPSRVKCRAEIYLPVNAFFRSPFKYTSEKGRKRELERLKKAPFFFRHWKVDTSLQYEENRGFPPSNLHVTRHRDQLRAAIGWDAREWAWPFYPRLKCFEKGGNNIKRNPAKSFGEEPVRIFFSLPDFSSIFLFLVCYLLNVNHVEQAALHEILLLPVQKTWSLS